MPTSWTYPTLISQYCEVPNHIEWVNNTTHFIDTELDLKTYESEINLIRSAKDLLHISNPTANDLKMKTYYLVLKGFKFENLPQTISGIEIGVNIRRIGRITDDTIMLYSNGPIGDNKADADLSNNKVYGGDADLWGFDQFTEGQLRDPNFGIVLRYQSHPMWPHKVTPNMDHVQMRVW